MRMRHAACPHLLIPSQQLLLCCHILLIHVVQLCLCAGQLGFGLQRMTCARQQPPFRLKKRAQGMLLSSSCACSFWCHC